MTEEEKNIIIKRDEIWIGIDACKINKDTDNGYINTDIALEIMTDEWIHNQNFCDETMQNMRDLLKHYRNKEKIKRIKKILK
jgi:hypothetical protein